RLGFGLVHLANAVTVGPDLTRQAQAGCEWLAELSEETVTLSVLEGDESVTVDQIISTSTVVTRSWLGRRTPLHCTSPGKVFLASLPTSRRSGIIAGRHERHTERTIVDPERLREEVERVRVDGYATAFEELEDGLSSAAAPIRGVDGSVVAAIGVSGPSYRLDADRMREVVPLVCEAADRVSAGLGHL
ncbi:MAG: IclR family transcriptional regulator, partial [Nocardioidaceae bacterium]